MPRQPQDSTERRRIHAVVLDDPEQTLTVVRTLRASGFDVADVHTPFAVHGLDEALGIKETRLPWATFVGGLTGCALAFGFQVWTHAVDWPLNIGGKTNVAWPALIPVTFEVTVLLAAIATVGALLFTGRLFPSLGGRTPKYQPDARVTDDRFVVLVAENDAAFSEHQFRSLCNELDVQEIVEGWRVK